MFIKSDKNMFLSSCISSLTSTGKDVICVLSDLYFVLLFSRESNLKGNLFNSRHQFHQHFMCRFQKHKNTVKLPVFFILLGSVSIIAGPKMLMKLTPGGQPWVLKMRTVWPRYIFILITILIIWDKLKINVNSTNFL